MQIKRWEKSESSILLVDCTFYGMFRHFSSAKYSQSITIKRIQFNTETGSLIHGSPLPKSLVLLRAIDSNRQNSGQVVREYWSRSYYSQPNCCRISIGLEKYAFWHYCDVWFRYKWLRSKLCSQICCYNMRRYRLLWYDCKSNNSWLGWKRSKSSYKWNTLPSQGIRG